MTAAVNTAATEHKRIKWIDSLKGFATVCVVLGHVADGYLSAGLFPEHRSVLDAVFNVIYLFHMPLFFVLSGMTFQTAYGFEIREKGRTERLRGQLINIMLLYFFYCLLIGCFKIMFSGSVNKPVGVKDLLLLWGKPIYPYWYFYVLAVFYAVFSIKRVICMKSAVLFPILFCVSLAGTYADTHDWFQVQHILFNGLFFFLGVSYIKGDLTKLFSPAPAAAVFAVSCVTAALFFDDSRYVYNVPLINTVTAFGVSVGLICLFSTIKIFGEMKLMTYIGRHCLEVYVLHCFLTAGNRAFFPKLGINNFYISVILNLIISTSLPLLFGIITKKTGIYELFFKPYGFLLSCRKKAAEKQNNQEQTTQQRKM
ncbi:MAG: acyltransferase [Ruminococcus sp.]|nr:acyltransferase [Ruminococcus sp.]